MVLYVKIYKNCPRPHQRDGHGRDGEANPSGDEQGAEGCGLARGIARNGDGVREHLYLDDACLYNGYCRHERDLFRP